LPAKLEKASEAAVALKRGEIEEKLSAAKEHFPGACVIPLRHYFSNRSGG
jgi:hypothetical protein